MPAKRLSWKTALIAALSLAVLAFAGPWAFERALAWRYHLVPVVEKLPTPRDRAEAMRQDLEVLGQLSKLDRSFSPEALARFEAERAKLVARAHELTPSMLEMEVSRIVALSDNGHTTVGRRLRRLNRVPIRLGWFEEGLYVTRADEARANLVGARVMKVNGKTPEEALAAITPRVSGTTAHAKATSPLYLASPYGLAGIWPEMDPDRATYTLRTEKGETVEVALVATPPDAKSPYVDPTRDLAPQGVRNESEPWRNLLSGRSDLPLVLREPDASLFVKSLDDGAGLYVHIMQVMDDERGSLSEQLEALTRAIEPGSLRYAILDLRFNGGGNYMKTLGFTKELPKRIAPDGRLFILTDHSTFSAAIVTFARARYFAGKRAVVIGEPVGDRERFWAEAGAPLVLPNSKITVFFATGYHDWHSGCGVRDLARCFWINWAFDVPSGSFAPDEVVAWKFADYRRGVDTVMEAVMKRRESLPGKSS